jgi:activator of 2-hydroxyglutaryl-CoA dehydratase
VRLNTGSMGEKYYIGVDAGSVSVNGIVINQAREIVYEAPYIRHMGRVEEEVFALVQDL